MKTLIIILFLSWGLNSFSQTTTNKSKSKKSKTTLSSQTTANNSLAKPRQTITEKYLNGNRAANEASKTAVKDSSPFVSGIHAAPNAKKVYDSIPPANPNSIEHNTRATTSTAVIGDTIANANTVIESGIPTTSGAVDKSGQTQFGQSNWGSSRGTVGESQWTVPPPVTSSFVKEYPTATNIAWIRSATDSSVYSARYKAGAEWIVSSYNATGNRLDRRTEISLQQLPQTVDTYMKGQPATFQATYINRLQIQGKPEVYEIRTKSGQVIYLDMEGREVRY